jgi:hypothetical protein
MTHRCPGSSIQPLGMSVQILEALVIYRASIVALSLCLAIPAESLAQATASGPSRTPASVGAAAQRQLVGCYAFFDRSGRAAAKSLYWAPATARLDSNGHAVKLTPQFDPGRDTDGPGAYRWSLTPRADSVNVLFHTGFSGTEFRFAVPERGDTLRGRARQHWDFGPPFETDGGPATAVRISCGPSAPSPPSPDA